MAKDDLRSIIGAPIPYGSCKVYSWRFSKITEEKKAKLCYFVTV